MDSKDLIRLLQLKPHPEGGFYKETYRSNLSIVTADGNNRSVSTAIYYLLENEDKSHLHRIRSDERWFFHQGAPLEIILIENNQVTTILMGNNIEQGEVPQAGIPANTWFAAKIKNDIGYSLVSCTVAPGFDFSDFELAKRQMLIEEYPHLKSTIEKFT